MNRVIQVLCIFLVLSVRNSLSAKNPNPNNDSPNANETNCNDLESSILCNGARVFRNIMKYMKESDSTPLIIVPGLEIVPLEKHKADADAENARSNLVNDDSTGTYLGRIGSYLRSHEIKIKFSDLMDKNNFKDNLMKALQNFDESTNGTTSEARRRDKGMGTFMVMGLMMAKLMATLGLGGIGALAMKALGVSMLALLLSGIIGVKTLASSGHDDGGHHVQYITAEHGHHRRRRHIQNLNEDGTAAGEVLPLPYRGWRHL